MSVLGTPYYYTGTSPRTGFDCSGFVQWVYKTAFGIDPGRTTVDELNNNMIVGKDQNWELDMSLIQPGDLIEYGYPGSSGGNAHVVIYIGDGKVIQAGGSNVNITNLFQSASPDEPFLGVRRVVNFNLPSGITQGSASIYGPNGNTSAPSQGTVPGGAITASASDTSSPGAGICQLKINYKLGTVCVWQAGWTRALLGGLLIASGGVIALVSLSGLAGKELISSTIPGVTQIRSLSK